ncbi:MAG: MotA/TolQ/ExbB proton channel family protein [bacterium]
MWEMFTLASTGGSGGLDLFKIIWNAAPISKVVFFLLVVCSILSVAVIVERWIVLWRARAAVQLTKDQLESWSVRKEWVKARASIEGADRETSPLAAVLRIGLKNWQGLVQAGDSDKQSMEEKVADALGRELRLVKAGLRANLPILANIASVAPFIGLFGTVIGIILTFDAIAKSGSMGQDLVASGIADALIATAMGLFAAIPAVIAYNIFTDKFNILVLNMEEIAMQYVFPLVESYQEDKG